MVNFPAFPEPPVSAAITAPFSRVNVGVLTFNSPALPEFKVAVAKVTLPDNVTDSVAFMVNFPPSCAFSSLLLTVAVVTPAPF